MKDEMLLISRKDGDVFSIAKSSIIRIISSGTGDSRKTKFFYNEAKHSNEQDPTFETGMIILEEKDYYEWVSITRALELIHEFTKVTKELEIKEKGIVDPKI